MRRIVLPAIALILGMVVASWVVGQESKQGPPPKHTIKEVMKQAHGAKLVNKVIDGSASKEEKDQLLDLYISLFDNKPPKGESDKWMMNSGLLILAAARGRLGETGPRMN